jgi:hypothetical protein
MDWDRQGSHGKRALQRPMELPVQSFAGSLVAMDVKMASCPAPLCFCGSCPACPCTRISARRHMGQLSHPWGRSLSCTGCDTEAKQTAASRGRQAAAVGERVGRGCSGLGCLQPNPFLDPGTARRLHACGEGGRGGEREKTANTQHSHAFVERGGSAQFEEGKGRARQRERESRGRQGGGEGEVSVSEVAGRPGLTWKLARGAAASEWPLMHWT